MNPYKELAGQTLVYGLGTIIPRVLNFLLTPLYTYTLVESQFGIITELYSYVAFFMVMLTFGMETTFFRFSSLDSNQKKVFNNGFVTLLTTSIIFLIAVLIFNQPIAKTIGYEFYPSLLIYLALIIFFDVITALPLAKLRQENKARFFAIIRTCNVLINITLNIFFFVICKNSDSEFFNGLYNQDIGVGYAFISNLVASFFTFVVLLPSILKFKFEFNKELFSSMFKYAFPLVIVGFAGMVNEVADKLFLKYLTPESLEPLKQVGIYGANYKLAVLMTIFIQMFKYAAEPFFFKQAIKDDAKEIYSKVMTYFVIFCILIFLLVCLYIDIFKLLIGVNYRVGLYIVPIVLLANMFLGIYYNLSVWYKISNLTKFGAFISLIGVVITVSMNIILIPLIGYMGSALATLVCYFIMVLISYFMGQKHYKIKYQINRILFYIISGIILVVAFYYFDIESVVFRFLVSTSFILLFIIIVIKVESINFENFKKFILKG
ncbi:MAG: oligosaccharide flippase family protein [Salinivirgaceae bacterium]|jgi:O-antigen/teichoic acid export membrane protein|nr:oligosaccharide flippase family protein [Salinivirgaceae bacterium]